MTKQQRSAIQDAINIVIKIGHTTHDELRLAAVEAMLRDALGQSHGLRRWRLGERTAIANHLRPNTTKGAHPARRRSFLKCEQLRSM